MSDTIVEVLVLAFEVGLTPSTAHVVFFALVVLMDCKCFLGELSFAVLARQLCLLAAGKMLTDIPASELALAVHALDAMELTLLLHVLVDQVTVHLCRTPVGVVWALHSFELALHLFVDL